MSAKGRTKGTGSLRERSPKVWELKVFRGSDVNGKKHYSYQTFHGSKQQAEIALCRFVVEVEDTVAKYGVSAAHQKFKIKPKEVLTVAALIDEYILRTKVKASTKERYIQYARNIDGELGNMPVNAVDVEFLEDYYVRLSKNGGVWQKGLSDSTLHNINCLVGAAFRWGIGRKKVSHDPTRGLSMPSTDDDEVEKMKVLSLNDTNRLVHYCLNSSSPWAIPTLISAMTGMRRGEVCALKWAGLDFNTRTITIGHSLNSRSKLTSPKTKTSRRRIVVSSTLMDALRKHRDMQQLDQIRMGRDYVYQDYICARDNGCPLLPDNLTRGFKGLLKEIGLPQIRFHDLRHTFASIILKTKPVHVVSAYLGHANPRITLEVYAHLLPGMGEEVPIALDEELGAPNPEALQDVA